MQHARRRAALALHLPLLLAASLSLALYGTSWWAQRPAFLAAGGFLVAIVVPLALAAAAFEGRAARGTAAPLVATAVVFAVGLAAHARLDGHLGGLLFWGAFALIALGNGTLAVATARFTRALDEEVADPVAAAWASMPTARPNKDENEREERETEAAKPP